MKQTTHHNATSYQCYKYFNIKRKGYCLKDISALQRKIGTKRETKNKTLLLPSTLDTSPTWTIKRPTRKILHEFFMRNPTGCNGKNHVKSYTPKLHKTWLPHPKGIKLTIKIRQKAIATQAWLHRNNSNPSMHVMDFHKAIQTWETCYPFETQCCLLTWIKKLSYDICHAKRTSQKTCSTHNNLNPIVRFKTNWNTTKLLILEIFSHKKKKLKHHTKQHENHGNQQQW